MLLSVMNEPSCRVVVKSLTTIDQKFCPDIKQPRCSIRNYLPNGFWVPELLDVVRRAEQPWLPLTIWEPGPGADTKHLKQIYLFSAPSSGRCVPQGLSRALLCVLVQLHLMHSSHELTGKKCTSSWALRLEMSNFHLVIYAHSGNGSTICLVGSWFTDHNGKGCDGTYISELSMNEVFWIKK